MSCVSSSAVMFAMCVYYHVTEMEWGYYIMMAYVEINKVQQNIVVG